jgi:hypothetical protein
VVTRNKTTLRAMVVNGGDIHVPSKVMKEAYADENAKRNQKDFKRKVGKMLY